MTPSVVPLVSCPNCGESVPPAHACIRCGHTDLGRPPPLDPARDEELREWAKEIIACAPAREASYREFAGAVLECLADLAAARDKADAGDRFKAFVHSYLDQHGVPHGDPTNQHQIEGCRIGARLDLLFAQRDAARKKLAELEEYIASTHDHDD